jgi:hypothetical protein
VLNLFSQKLHAKARKTGGGAAPKERRGSRMEDRRQRMEQSDPVLSDTFDGGVSHDLTLGHSMKMQITVMLAWIAGIQARADASGNVHVNLDSSSPCWNECARESATSAR